ncbi:hypothetical protein ABIE37_003467 [Arthrobacter bambusae]|uniref:Uncharacterized protein n=1 Tax=Arthrobacter bambusae TaxID=1338426 RepID=A0ABV2PA66_9MICC
MIGLLISASQKPASTMSASARIGIPQRASCIDNVGSVLGRTFYVLAVLVLSVVDLGVPDEVFLILDDFSDLPSAGVVPVVVLLGFFCGFLGG